MKAVITVTGKDSVGIIANVANECAKYDANIVDISQSVLSEYFAMIMLVELDGMRTVCIRLDKPLGNKGFMLGESVQYTVWVKSDTPICACFGRLDVRQPNMAYYSVEGYSF